MKVSYNQYDIALFPTDSSWQDPCDNCIFINPEQNYTCTLADFGKDVIEILPSCGEGIFIPESLSNIFKL